MMIVGVVMMSMRMWMVVRMIMGSVILAPGRTFFPCLMKLSGMQQVFRAERLA